MTNEQARERLRGILTEAVEFENSVCYVTEEDREPLEMAIKALEQEPCEDAISRQSMLDYLKYLHGEMPEEEFIKELPSVTPTHKKGKWIPCSERMPKACEFVNCTCRSLIDDREDWVIETIYIPQSSYSPYSDWGNIPMLNDGKCEVIAWMHRNIPEPYKAESEVEKNEKLKKEYEF